MKAYDGSDTPKTEPERERMVASILDRLEKLELSSDEVEAKLDSFSEEMFGFTHDEKRVDQVVERGICGKIQFRISNISSALNDMSVELNAMMDELPQKKE